MGASPDCRPHTARLYSADSPHGEMLLRRDLSETSPKHRQLGTGQLTRSGGTAKATSRSRAAGSPPGTRRHTGTIPSTPQLAATAPLLPVPGLAV